MTPEQWQTVKQVFHQAVELPPEERAAILLQAHLDDELRDEVESLLASHDEAEGFIETPISGSLVTEKDAEARDPMIGTRLGGYRIIREIGHGGMGAVYLAERADEQFSKRVAVKLIRGGMSSSFIIRRFLNERQILANLDHPNIARLLDGGTTDQGLPYLVMEYIEGQPITDYCDEDRIGTDGRLALFRKVCSAVHCAHQNLVIHRDIKPGNILVTADGTVKLLDFGIAKLLAPASGTPPNTGMTARVLTPDYASPEQIRGEAITTASDVYSLGVLLYELLSGHRPYQVESESPLEVIKAICEQEPEKPSTALARIETGGVEAETTVMLTPESVSRARDSEPNKLRRQLQGDLDNIVLMAMRKEAQRRYSSAEQLSEDIRRHMEGLPVIARKDTFSYRADRFVRRHKAAVAAAVLVFAALIAGAGVTLREAHVARIERDKAQNRFNQVRKLANSVLFTYHDGIQKLPGSTPIREVMVKDALEYLDNLSKESDGDLGLERELAEAYKKVGDVRGSTVYGNTGDAAGMLESYRKALAIREKIVQVKGATTDDQRELARMYVAVGTALDRSGDNARGLELVRKASGIFETLLAADPAGIRTRIDAARANWYTANLLATAGRYPEAIDNYRKAANTYQELAVAEPSNPNHRRNQVLTYKYLGTLLELTGDARGALDLYRKAVETDQALVALDPNDANAKLDLSFSYGSMGRSLTLLGDLDEALNNDRKAVELSLAVAQADPKNAFAQGAVAKAYQTLGETMEKRGDLTAAIENNRKAAEAYHALAVSDPGDREVRSREALSYAFLGRVYTEMVPKERSTAAKIEHWRAARLWYKRSLDIWTDLRGRGPLISAFQKEPDRVAGEIARCDAALSGHP